MSYTLTASEFEKLKQMEKDLDVSERNIIKAINEIKEKDSDFLNNQSYYQLRRQLKIEIPKRRENIRKIIKQATVIDSSDEISFDGKTVAINTKVTLDYCGECVETFVIRATNDCDFENDVLSCNAPIARLIIGKEKGDFVVFKDTKVVILDVEKV